jgi:hypothetical protein
MFSILYKKSVKPSVLKALITYDILNFIYYGINPGSIAVDPEILNKNKSFL